MQLMTQNKNLFYALVNYHTLFLRFDQLPVFYPLFIQCHEISPGVPWNSCEDFVAGITPYGTISYFLSQPLPLIMSLSSPSPSSSDYITRVSSVVVIPFAQSTISSINLFMCYLNFTSRVVTFCFFVALTFCCPIPYLDYPLKKMSCGFIMGKQGGNRTIHFAVCV